MTTSNTTRRGRPMGKLTAKLVSLKIGESFNVTNRDRAVLGSFVYAAKQRTGYNFKTHQYRAGRVTVTRVPMKKAA